VEKMMKGLRVEIEEWGWWYINIPSIHPTPSIEMIGTSRSTRERKKSIYPSEREGVNREETHPPFFST